MALMVDVKIILMVAWALAITYHGTAQNTTGPVGQDTTIATNSDEGLTTEVMTTPVTTTTEEPVTMTTAAANTTKAPTTTTEATTEEPITISTEVPSRKSVWLLVKDFPWTQFELDKFGAMQGKSGGTGRASHPDIDGNVRISMLSLDEMRNDPTKILTTLCSKIDETEPDIVLDFTMTGLASEAVKVTTRGLKIPTVAISPGFPGDIREWRNLSPEEEEYLIQILPPSAATLRIARLLSSEFELPNLVIFYGEGYANIATIPSVQKSLLLDTITRHIFVPMKSRTEKETLNKIYRQLNNGYNNFLIIGSSDEIERFMEIPGNESLVKDEHPIFNNKTSWFTLSERVAPVLSRAKRFTETMHIYMENVIVDLRSRVTSSTEGPTLDEIARYEVFLTVAQAYKKLKSSVPETWIDGSRLTCRTYKLGNYTTQYKPKLKTEMALAVSAANKELRSFQKRVPSLILAENGLSQYNVNYTVVIVTVKMIAGFYEIKPVGNIRIDRKGDYVLDHVSGSDSSIAEFKTSTIYRVITVVQPPFVYQKKDCTPEHEFDHCFYGYAIDILNELQKALKFNYTLKSVRNYGFMADKVPFQWDGMVRMLQDQEADLAVGAISVYPEREQAIDFTANIYGLVGYQVLMRREKLKTSLFKFMTVLENDVWMCILGAFFFTSGLMWIFDRWSPYSFQNNKEKYEDDEEKREFTLKESLWFCMTSLTPQGGGEAPKNLSGRLVAATWWLFGFIIIASYTANLAAFLTVSRLEVPIETLEDLAKQYKVQYAPILHSSTWHHFDRMAHVEHAFYEVWKDMSLNDSLSDYERSLLAVWEYPVSDKYTKIWQAILENQPPPDAADAVRRVRSKEPTYNENPNIPDEQIDEFAWISESTEIKYYHMTSCLFRIVGKEFAMVPYAFMVQKGSPLKEILSKEIRSLESRRYFEAFDRKWWDDNPEQLICAKDDDLADGISVGNIGGVFVIIMVGLSSTILALIMECWWYSRTQDVDEMSDIEHDDRSLSRDFSATYSTREKTDFTSPFSATLDRFN